MELSTTLRDRLVGVWLQDLPKEEDHVPITPEHVHDVATTYSTLQTQLEQRTTELYDAADFRTRYDLYSTAARRLLEEGLSLPASQFLHSYGQLIQTPEGKRKTLLRDTAHRFNLGVASALHTTDFSSQYPGYSFFKAYTSPVMSAVILETPPVNVQLDRYTATAKIPSALLEVNVEGPDSPRGKEASERAWTFRPKVRLRKYHPSFEPVARTEDTQYQKDSSSGTLEQYPTFYLRPTSEDEGATRTALAYLNSILSQATSRLEAQQGSDANPEITSIQALLESSAK